MSKDVALFEGQNSLPAHLADMFGDEGNIDAGSKINALSIRGKVFRIVYEGDEKTITKYNEETGDHEPVTTVRLIVLNQGPFGARVYYGKAYSSSEGGEAPKCFSLDGKYPDPAATEPQARTCATCPHAVKGSKITESGAQTTACQLQRRLAVVPEKKPDFPPLLLRLAPTSAYDPDTKGAENGWMAWRQYTDFLNSRGVRHTAQLVTTLRFDPNAEHPKLLFKPERFLSEEEAKIVAPRLNSEEVLELIQAPENAGPAVVADATPPGSQEQPEEQEEDVEEAETEEAETEEQEEADDDGGAETVKPSESQPAKKKASKKKASKKKVARKAADDDDADEGIERQAAAGSPSPEAKKEGKPDLEKLLDDWDA